MEKLVKLLNEYEKYKIKDSEGLDVMYIWKYEGTLYYYNDYKDENIFDNVRFLIISKGYGFIQWLVDNDKIDTVLFANELNKVVYLADFNFRNDEGFYKTIYKQLLMLLSIQDNPIEFLISILK